MTPLTQLIHPAAASGVALRGCAGCAHYVPASKTCARVTAQSSLPSADAAAVRGTPWCAPQWEHPESDEHWR
jgi:hypothetical protein